MYVYIYVCLYVLITHFILIMKFSKSDVLWNHCIITKYTGFITFGSKTMFFRNNTLLRRQASRTLQVSSHIPGQF